MTDSELLQLMFHHILFWDAEKVIRDQRYSIIVDEMQQRERRTTPFQADIQVDQVVLLGVGQCGQGDERRVVESSFEVKKGDQLFVYREGK